MFSRVHNRYTPCPIKLKRQPHPPGRVKPESSSPPADPVDLSSTVSLPQSLAGVLSAFSTSTPLYDLRHGPTREHYEAARHSATELSDRVNNASYGQIDTRISDEIKFIVKDAVRRYGDGGVVVLSGAGHHWWQALPGLKKDAGASYQATSGYAMNVDRDDPAKMEIQVARGTLVAQQAGSTAAIGPPPAAAAVPKSVVGKKYADWSGGRHTLGHLCSRDPLAEANLLKFRRPTKLAPRDLATV